MKFKKLLTSASLLSVGTFAAFSLTSCSDSRNVTVPTSDINLDSVVATALDGKLKLTAKDYYNQLRYSGTNIVNNKIKEALYNKEFKTVNALFYDEALTDEQKNLIIPTKNEEKLFSLTDTNLSDVDGEDNLTYIKKNLVNKITKNIVSQIYGTSSAKAIKKIKDKDKTEKMKKFIVSKARTGMNFTESDLSYTLATDGSDNIILDHIKDDKFKRLVKSYLLTEAETLASQNALYKIADEEYVKAYDAEEDDEPTKNTNLIYDKDEDYLKDQYDATYKTYGTYHAIIIQFDSLRDATKATEGLNFEGKSLDEVKEMYLDLYKTQYNYKSSAISGFDDDIFTFEVSSIKDGFEDLSSEIQTLVKDTLEEDENDITKQFLTEPRNINNKYVMAIRYDSTYSINNKNEETEWKELSDDIKNSLKAKIKYQLLTTKASSYSSTLYKSMIYNRSNNDDSSDDIFIYDPVFEYRFNETYTDDYKLIDKDSFNNDNIFSIKLDNNETFNYSVKDFYNDASLELGSTTIYTYFNYEYAYLYYDDYIDSDTHDANVETLEDAISDFNSNNNASYSKDLGLENYLLLSYGYTTKDDVIKYYYDAKSCLTSYLAQATFKEWAVANGDANKYDENLASSGILKNILDLGNESYADLFKINLDHMLINIDDDADGSPDDPEEFFDKTGTSKAEYEAEVTKLAQAIYEEALYIRDNYSETKTLFEILTYIKNQYELGEKMFSTNSTWEEWKDTNITFNFLLTVEQLSSSSDIDQSSVKNFVERFKTYVIDSYKACVNQDVQTSFEYGRFYVYDENSKEITLCNDLSSKSNITADKMCATEFGYHLLILNSYTEPSSTAYTESKDPSGIQAAIEVLVYKDKDDEDNDTYVTTNSYNNYVSQIAFNQLFIYYCQNALSQTSSLDSSIYSLMTDMYNDIINTYKSDNFQKYLLYDVLNIQIDNNELQANLAADRNYYKNQILEYNEATDDTKSIYYDWVNGDLSSWRRPNQK